MTCTSLFFVSFLVLVVANYCAAQTLSLGGCAPFAVMAGSTVVCSGASNCRVSNGYIGLSPGTSITGNWVNDRIHAAKQVKTSTSNACARDGLAALTNGKKLAGKTLSSGILGGKIFTPGVYHYTGGLTLSGRVFLNAKGDVNAKFFFIATTTLTTAAGSHVVFQNGAAAKNVYWILGTAATLGATSVLRGTILAGSAITVGTNGAIYGRAIAQTAVTCTTGCSITKR